MIQKKIEGLVLKKIPYSEGDWILTFLTEEGARLTGIAKSARKSHKRFNGGLDLFNQSQIIYREKMGSDLVYLEQTEIVCPMEGVKKNLIKFAAACYFAEMIIEFLQEKQKIVSLYPFFSQFLKSLNSEKDLPPPVIPLMEHQLLELFGFKPTLHHCLTCKQDINANGSYFFNGAKGGIVCSECSPSNGERKTSFQHEKLLNNDSVASHHWDSYPLGYPSLQQLIKAKHVSPNNWDKGSEFNWKPIEVKEVRKAFEFFLQYTAGKPFRSLPFLSSVLA